MLTQKFDSPSKTSKNVFSMAKRGVQSLAPPINSTIPGRNKASLSEFVLDKKGNKKLKNLGVIKKLKQK